MAELHLSPEEGGADDEEYVTSTVRPYALTGGRTAPKDAKAIPVEALVQAKAKPGPTTTTETRKILEHTQDYVSMAELSAHLKLPMGVVQILVNDLIEADQVRVHGMSANEQNHAHSLSVLESVLNGISAL